MERKMARICAALLIAILGFVASGSEAIECYTEDSCTGKTVDVSSSQECCLGLGSSFIAVAGSGQCRQCGGVVTVRFLQSEYAVLRSDEFVTVCLTKDLATATTVTVRISTEDGTALDGLDYTGGSFYVILSSSAAAVACQNITILGLSLQETVFFVRIDSAPKGVIIGEPNIANVTIALADNRFDCMKDTVLGDPLFVVPLRIDANFLHLCYEVHGRPNEYFNLITSKCVLVNARYRPIDPFRNIIDQIAIRAVYTTVVANLGEVTGCQDITVSLNDCKPSTEAMPPGITIERFEATKFPPRVIVRVPNCDDEKPLEMHIICEADMLRFEVLRGVTGGHTDTHGLLGQFWNNPTALEPSGDPISDCDPDDIFTAEIATRGRKGFNPNPSIGDRKFTGCLFQRKWNEEHPGDCLYAGDRQAGPKPDSVIEGNYEDYIVERQFGDLKRYPRFDTTLC